MRAFPALILVMGAMTLAGCQTAPPVVLSHSPLKEQRLRWRDGFHGLTNQTCAEYAADGLTCSRMDVVEYNLEDAATRQLLVDEGFYCTVSGRRFKLCEDSGKELCRTTYVWCGFLRTQRCEKVERAPIDPRILTLKDAVCVSRFTYPYGPEIEASP